MFDIFHWCQPTNYANYWSNNLPKTKVSFYERRKELSKHYESVIYFYGFLIQFNGNSNNIFIYQLSSK